MQKNCISITNNSSYDELQSGCLGKQELTIHEINKIKKEISFSKRRVKIAYYKCRFCEYYHLTGGKK